MQRIADWIDQVISNVKDEALHARIRAGGARVLAGLPMPRHSRLRGICPSAWKSVSRPDCRDSLGESVQRSIVEDLGFSVDKVRTVDVYTIDAEPDAEEVERLRTELFTDPIVQDSSATARLARDFSWVIEVGFRPGVTDNVGKTAREGIEVVLGRALATDEAVYTSRQYLLSGQLTQG